MNGGGPTTTTTLTNTLNNSNMLSNTQETSVSLKLYGDGTGYLLNIYIDTLFGTFASQLPSAPGPWNIVVTGQLPNFPNQMITLQQGKLKVNTFTDAHGNYAFHDAGFKNGPMTIIKNGVSTPLTYTGKILQNPKINQPPPKMNQPSGA